MKNRQGQSLFITGVLAVFILALSCAGVCETADRSMFGGRDGCFLMVEQESGKVVECVNPARCRERLSPCSTFKAAAALMAYDQCIIDNSTVFKWNGTCHNREACNRDHTPQTWMGDSVLWVTQKLMAQTGSEKLKRYLHLFQYGNQDMSGGMENAWIMSSLKISAEEQVRFMRALWRGILPVSARAQAETKKILAVERRGSDCLDGKTGTGDVSPGIQQGWFAGHLNHDGKDYILAINITDREAGQTKRYAGPEARQLALEHLLKRGYLDAAAWQKH